MKRTAAIVVFALLSAVNTAADVAPDPGYVRREVSLIIESDSDLTGYRFLLSSPAGLEEITVLSGSPTIIRASGRSGTARYGELWAVPNAETGEVTVEQMKDVPWQKYGPNAKHLLSHNFQTFIPESEKLNWQDPVYRISVEDGVVSATPIAGGSPGGRRMTYSIWQFVGPVAVAGLLLAAGLAVTGISLFRRRTGRGRTQEA